MLRERASAHSDLIPSSWASGARLRLVAGLLWVRYRQDKGAGSIRREPHAPVV